MGFKICRVSKTPPQPLYGGWWGLAGGWRGLVGAGELALIFSPLGEKVYFWGKKGLEKGVLGGWGLAPKARGTGGRLKMGASPPRRHQPPLAPSPHEKITCIWGGGV